MNVGNPLDRSLISSDTGESTLEKCITNVVIVGKPLAAKLNSLNMSEFTVEKRRMIVVIEENTS